MSHATSLVQSFLDILSLMGEFSRKDDLSSRVVHDGDPCGLTPWVKLDPQFCHHGISDFYLEYKSEWIAPEYGCFPSREQYSRSCWMNRIQWLFVGIYDKNVTQVFTPRASLTGPLVAQVMVASTLLWSGLA